MYTLDWVADERIIYLHNKGTLSSEEIKQLSRELEKMMDEAVAPLHIIEDDRDLKKIELSLDAVQKTFDAVDFSKLGYTIAIVPESLEDVADILGNFWDFLTDVNYERVETAPEALEYLAEHDASLPDRSEWKLNLA